jgi:anti-sigma regulatory factor (Ser/Thr protein kinase)
MELQLAVRLPRDLEKLNTLRHLLDAALQTLGVAAACRADIGLIVSETWTNAVSNVRAGHQYEVVVTVADDRFAVTVNGPGEGPDRADTNVLTESGHGVHIVSELADTMQVEPNGLLRQATKKLTWTQAPFSGNAAWTS